MYRVKFRVKEDISEGCYEAYTSQQEFDSLEDAVQFYGLLTIWLNTGIDNLTAPERKRHDELIEEYHYDGKLISVEGIFQLVENRIL